MIQDKENFKNKYLTAFKKFEAGLNGLSESAFHKIRKEAVSKFDELDFPTTRNEEWKYTNVLPMLGNNFVNSSPEKINTVLKINDDILKLVESLNAEFLVFINGYFSENLSKICSNADGIVIDNLANALIKHTDKVNKHLAQYAENDNGFTALNTAFTQDGAFIQVSKNKIIDRPVFILHLSGDEKENLIINPRNLIVAEPNSQVTIIECYQGINSKPYFNNNVTEVISEENAHVEYYKIQTEDYNSYHISKTQVQLERNGNFVHNQISFGGALVRNDINSVMNGEGCEVHYNGLYLVTDEQHVDNHTLMDHAKPNCFSNELYKGILAGKSRGVFNGKVIVRPDAQKTNAYQSNKNIILSDEALMNTKPQLEIFADDVKCSHGATVGQLEEEQVFYLRSRGIDEKKSRSILIHAFAGDVIELIKEEPLKEYVHKIVFDHMHSNIEHE
jgi:Fe-S cluster assembly protein SufD